MCPASLRGRLKDIILFQSVTNLYYERFIEPRYRAGRRYENIDPKIEKLVNSLNRLPHITTIGSCQGHCIGHSVLPYLYFYAPVEFASWLHQWCYQQQCLNKESSTLNWPWELTGRFDIHGKQTFLLSTPALSFQCSIPLLRQHLLGWHRKQWDEDLLTIARKISIYEENQRSNS